MKNIILVFLSIAATLVACKEEDNTPSDFRAEYVGKYNCNVNINCYGALGTCSYNYDTLLSVYYGNSDTTMLFIGREICLDSTDSYYDYHYGLYFRNDNVFSTFMNGGLGGGQYEYIKGMKISDTP